MLSQTQIEETYLQGITAFKPEEVQDLFWKIYNKEKEPFKQSKHFNWHLFFNTIRKRLIDAIENSNISITGSTLDEVKNSITSHREKAKKPITPTERKNTCDVINYKDEFISLLMTKEKDQSWLDYYKKKYQYVLKLDSGRYYPIEKPKIDKTFCFCAGYGTNEEENKRAYSKMYSCYTEKGFFNNNIREFITNYNEHCYVDFKPNKTYYSYIVDSRFNECWIADQDQKCWDTYKEEHDFQELTEQDIKNIKLAQNYVLKDFIKRLNSYLKKYGTKSVNAWVFYDD